MQNTETRSILKGSKNDNNNNNNNNNANHSSSSSSLSFEGKKKKVCFDDVQIREFAMIMGDNPAVSKGAPVQIDWKYQHEDAMDLEMFEHLRQPVRRHRKKLVLNARKRAKILLSSGYTVDEIADMTLVCQNMKKLRVESVKNFNNMNDNYFIPSNLADFLTGTAEVTGQTLKLVGLDKISTAGMDVVRGTGKIVLGTGKMATDAALGATKLSRDVVLGTGKVVADTGTLLVKGTTGVVVGTGKVATDVVTGTVKGTASVVTTSGQYLMKGTMTGGKSLMGAARRVTGIFAPADMIRESNLKEGKEHLKHVHRTSNPDLFGLAENDDNDDDDADYRSNKINSDWEPRRRTTRAKKQNERSPKTSPKTSPNTSPKRNANKSPKRRQQQQTKAAVAPIAPASLGGDGVFDELQEMEEFMLHLQGLTPDQVKAAMASG